MPKPTAFGRYVKKKRTEAGLSLRFVADKLGISHVFLGEIERGVRKVLHRERWSALLKVIPGTSLAELDNAAKVSQGIQIDLNDASPQYQDLAFTLARRIEQQDLSSSELDRLLRVLEGENE